MRRAEAANEAGELYGSAEADNDKLFIVHLSAAKALVVLRKSSNLAGLF